MKYNPVNTKPLKIAAACFAVLLLTAVIMVYNSDLNRRRKSHNILIASHKRLACEIAGNCLLQYQKDHPDTDNWLADYADYVVDKGSVFFHEIPQSKYDRSFDLGIYIIGKGTGSEGPVLVGYSDVTGSVDGEFYCNAIFIKNERVLVVQKFKEIRLIQIVGLEQYISRKRTLYFAPFRK